MIRAFRGRDAPQLIRLYLENFREEESYLGTDTAVMERIIRRIYRPSSRFVLGFLRLFGRPVFRLFAEEVDGELAGPALLTFTTLAGHVSLVQGDSRFRRRGLAKELMVACEAEARSAGRRYLVLDVLLSNLPARSLYDQLGFRCLRECAMLVRDRPSEPLKASMELSPAPRRVTRRDAVQLAEMARAALTSEVLTILPPAPGDYLSAPLVARSLESESVGWVHDDGRSPTAFMRTSASRATASGHLTAPLLSPNLSDEPAGKFLRFGLRWLDERRVPRILTEVPVQDHRAMSLLKSNGFTEAHRLNTLYRPLA